MYSASLRTSVMPLPCSAKSLNRVAYSLVCLSFSAMTPVFVPHVLMRFST